MDRAERQHPRVVAPRRDRRRRPADGEPRGVRRHPAAAEGRRHDRRWPTWWCAASARPPGRCAPTSRSWRAGGRSRARPRSAWARRWRGGSTTPASARRSASPAATGPWSAASPPTARRSSRRSGARTSRSCRCSGATTSSRSPSGSRTPAAFEEAKRTLEADKRVTRGRPPRGRLLRRSSPQLLGRILQILAIMITEHHGAGRDLRGDQHDVRGRGGAELRRSPCCSRSASTRGACWRASWRSRR